MSRFKIFCFVTSVTSAFFLSLFQANAQTPDADAFAALARQNACPVGCSDVLQSMLQNDLTPETRATLQDALTSNLLYDGNFDVVAPTLFTSANILIAAAPQEASEGEPTLEELNRFGNLVAALNKLASNSPTNEAEAKSLIEELKKRYPREASTFQKIETLEQSAERVRALEPAALQKYQETLDFLTNDAVETVEIYVAPEGSDVDGSGESVAPFASLARAFKRVEAESAPTKRFCVQMAPGEYFVNQTASLTNARNVLVRAQKEGTVELTGGRKITNFQKLNEGARDNSAVANAASRFLEPARDKIFVADLAALGFKNFGRLGHRGYGPGLERVPTPSLYFNGKLQTLAR